MYKYTQFSGFAGWITSLDVMLENHNGRGTKLQCCYDYARTPMREQVLPETVERHSFNQVRVNPDSPDRF